PGPEPHDLLGPQSELLPGGGPLLVRRGREPIHVDPPPNPTDSLPAKPELEETPLVRVRERDDRVETREAGLEEQIVQRTIRLVCRCGDRQRDGEGGRRSERPRPSPTRFRGRGRAVGARRTCRARSSCLRRGGTARFAIRRSGSAGTSTAQ